MRRSVHDPMVVAHEIRRPWPTWSREKVREGQPRWGVTIYGGRWWKPSAWSPFVVAFGRRWYFPAMLTVWHNEPGGRDSFAVCKHASRWKWHVWHWSIQVPPLQSLRARLFDRCAECGRKGRPNHSFQWDGHRLGWWKFKSREDLYHSECASLRSLRNTVIEHELIHRQTLGALCIAWDVPMAEVPRQLFPGSGGYSGQHDGPGDFNLRYRLEKLIERTADEPARVGR